MNSIAVVSDSFVLPFFVSALSYMLSKFHQNGEQKPIFFPLCECYSPLVLTHQIHQKNGMFSSIEKNGVYFMHHLSPVHIVNSRMGANSDELNRLMPFFMVTVLFFTVGKRKMGIDIWSIIREMDWILINPCPNSLGRFSGAEKKSTSI